MESGHGITSCVCDFSHFGKLVGAASSKVEEREFIEVLGLLISLFNDLYTMVSKQITKLVYIYYEAYLVVTLLESLLSESLPTFRAVDSTSCLECDIQIATFNCQVKPSSLVLDEVQSNLKAYMELRYLEIE